MSLGHFEPMALLLRPRCQHNLPAAGKLCRSWYPGGIDTANQAGSQSGRNRVAPGQRPWAAQVLPRSNHQPCPGGVRRTAKGQDGAGDGPCPLPACR